MLPPPHQVGTTILGNSEYIALYLIIMLSGPVALGTIIINQKDLNSVDCIPACTDCGNSTLLRPTSAAYVNNQCIERFSLMYSTTFFYILTIGLTFCVFIKIFFLRTSMVPQTCLDQVLKEFCELDSYSAGKIVTVMEILTRDEIQVDENTDKRVMAMAHHIYGRVKATRGFLMIKNRLIMTSISLSVIDIVIMICQQVISSQDGVEDRHQNQFCDVADIDKHLPTRFMCSRNRSLDDFLEITLTILIYSVTIYMCIQLIQCVYSFRYVRVIGFFASGRQKSDYWAVEEAKWLFRTRFGYDFKLEQANENVAINSGE